MTERYLTLTGSSRVPDEVEIDHWFKGADGKRYAVVYRWNDHGQAFFHVREEAHLMPCEEQGE